MKSLLLLFLMVFDVGADLGKLTEQENIETQDTCGKKAHYQRKVIHGDLAKKGDHPWAVSVYVRYTNATTGKFSTLLGPGTLISSRHIIAFNTIKRSKSGNLNIIGMEDTGVKETCEGDHMVLPKEMLSRYDVDLEHLKEFNGSRDFKDTVAKVTIMYGCKSLTTSNPMVLELVAPMEHDTVPACVSNSEYNWDEASGFSVYGMNKPGLLVSGRFAPVNCSVKAPFSCAEAVNKGEQGLCQGDFGGSAVANIDRRNTILGIYAAGNSRCGAKTETLAPFHFVNLGYYRQEICDITGVCVPAPPTEIATFKTTTHRPFTAPPLDPYGLPKLLTYAPPVRIATTETSPDYPFETTEDYDYTQEPEYIPDITEIPQAPYFEDGEKIVAETYAPMKIHVSNCTDGEEIKAERIDPMAVGARGATRGDRIPDIHIHIHLNQ